MGTTGGRFARQRRSQRAMTNGTPTRGLSPRSLAGVTGLTSVGVKRNMLAVALALLALLVALLVGLLVAPHAHTDSDDDFYSAAQSSVVTVNQPQLTGVSMRSAASFANRTLALRSTSSGTKSRTLL